LAFTFVLTESRGKVRLLVPDRVDTGHVFEDAEIDAFLAMEGASVKRAAALALETIASDEVLTQKAIRMLHLSLDGPSEARALLQRAGALRAQADKEELEADGSFDYAEMVVDQFSARQRIWNEGLRSS
jgi:hypothetical protein